MAIISECAYDAQGNLMRPGEFAVTRARMGGDYDTGGSLTLDRGRVHLHTLTARGVTPTQARQRANERLAAFFDRVECVDGYRKVSMKKTQGELAASGNFSISYEIIYAIEPPRWKRRSHSPESPDAGLSQDRSAADR